MDCDVSGVGCGCSTSCCYKALICLCCPYGSCGYLHADGSFGRNWPMHAALSATDGTQCFTISGTKLTMTTNGTITVSNPDGFDQSYTINGVAVDSPNDPQDVLAGDVITDFAMQASIFDCSPGIDPVSCTAQSIVCDNDGTQVCPCYEIVIADLSQSSSCDTTVDCPGPVSCPCDFCSGGNVILVVSGLACLCSVSDGSGHTMFCSDSGDGVFNGSFTLTVITTGFLTCNWHSNFSYTATISGTPTTVYFYYQLVSISGPTPWKLQVRFGCSDSFGNLLFFVAVWEVIINCDLGDTFTTPVTFYKVFANACWTVPDTVQVSCPLGMALDPALLPKAAPLKKTPAACVHRSEIETGVELCESCQGHTEIKIFKCAIYGTCTLGRQLPDHHCCHPAGGKTCSDYVPNE